MNIMSDGPRYFQDRNLTRFSEGYEHEEMKPFYDSLTPSRYLDLHVICLLQVGQGQTMFISFVLTLEIYPKSSKGSSFHRIVSD